MTRLFPTTLLLLLCTFCSVMQAKALGLGSLSPAAWEVTHQADSTNDITTWKQSLEGAALDAFKGEVTVNHSLLSVLAVLADVEQFPQWVFQCDSARLLPKAGPNITYLYIDGIWPVSDRDIVVRSTLMQNADSLAVTIHSVALPRLLPQSDGVVRVPALDNRFVLTPLGPEKTHIVFTTYADPGGLIPAWLANFVAESAPYDTLNDMRERLRLPLYQQATPKALEGWLPGSEQLTLPYH